MENPIVTASADHLSGLSLKNVLVEEGSALQAVRSDDAKLRVTPVETLDVVVIGGGQAGLAAGHYLAKRGLRFVILDASARVGDVWRKRWDSLRLFTPARYDSLPGLRFPAPQTSFPSKDDMAAYLESYAAYFRLPVRSSVEVDGVTREKDRYVVTAGRHRFEAKHVIVATSGYGDPWTPALAAELPPQIRQLHSSEYKNAGQLRPGSVLVVGAGNSGAEIALELGRSGRQTFLAGRETGEVPFRIESFISKILLVHIVLRLVFHRILTLGTPMGRRAQKNHAGKGTALIRTRSSDLTRAGVARVARVARIKDGMPELEDGTRLDTPNVIWCTGFSPRYSWLKLPIFQDNGRPMHDAGVVRGEPGLYFLGLPFLYAMSSIMIHGMPRDAARVVDVITRRMEARADAGSGERAPVK